MNRVFIIAEAGVNHNGDINTAFKLIDIAKKVGVDAIKFQTFSADSIISKHAPKAEYQNKTTDQSESQYEMIKKLELSREDHFLLQDYCRKIDIEFLSTPFDLESIDLLNELGINFFKIPSGEITNLPYLRKIARQLKPVIMSTGMSNLREVTTALDILCQKGLSYENITVMHCNTEYPTPYCDVNLNAMLTIKSSFPGISIGYSDHTEGIEVPVAAVALGAKVIEKHFTLCKDQDGPDHKASLEPQELCQMVHAIRNIEQAMGSFNKVASLSEQKNIAIARKSIVAKRDIHAGEILNDQNLTCKRPGTGITPMKWDNVIGHKAIHNFSKDDFIEL